jgi:hypothetical protein
LSEDLRAATLVALKMDRAACHQHALDYTWEKATGQFLGNLQQIDE